LDIRNSKNGSANWRKKFALQKENQHLRHSGRAFGDLAERLNVSLDAERRGAADHRQVLRWTEDRRRLDAERGRS
jgi:hypothetical protein